MSQSAEKALFGLLLEVDSIEKLVIEGFDTKFIPTAELRPVYDWAIRQFRISGNEIAPTASMFRETDAEGHGGKTLADVLADNGISVDDVPEGTVEWVVEELRSRWLTKKAGEWARKISEEITTAASEDRPGIFTTKVGELVALALELETKRTSFELIASGQDILDSYEDRKANADRFHGLHLGLGMVDDHTGGVHEGELMIIGAPPKTGKSYMLDRIALKEFEIGRAVALFTLENSIEMTRDRIACMATGIEPKRFEAGQCDKYEEDAVREWVDKLIGAEHDGQLWILSPTMGARSAEAMVSAAQIRGADSILIDQLTFVEAHDPKAPRYLQIREICHTVKTMISTGSNPMPCVMAHQISREGIKGARKVGYLHMDDMAEGSEVERTADWAMSMWASEDARQVNQFLLQTLASRRRDIKNWDIHWDISNGQMSVITERALD